MKALPFFPLGRSGCIIGIVNALLAIGLTVLSFWYIQPKDCYRECGVPEGMPCLSGGCRFGEQKAGWPLPAFVDAPGGGSPTGGWGMLGPEDLPLLVPLILDVLFYGILLWLVLYIIQLIRRQTLTPKLIAVTLPLNIFLAAFLWIFYSFFGNYLSIGRGHDIQVYVDTPTSTNSALAFSPIVSIPLNELIENYGDPDYVGFTSEGTTESPMIGVVLYWDSIGMFVKLPSIANKTYVIQKKTTVAMIIFFNERQQVLRIAGKPLGREKISWTGYGEYQP
jgi:phosphoethanolamine transferase EptA/EptB